MKIRNTIKQPVFDLMVWFCILSYILKLNFRYDFVIQSWNLQNLHDIMLDELEVIYSAYLANISQKSIRYTMVHGRLM